jgi:Raf kinase inhibitor-like YbhB/YbcL family protein
MLQTKRLRGSPRTTGSKKDTLSTGSGQGMRDFGRTGHGDPCPPGGTHRYSLKIYALDKRLGVALGARKADLLKTMEGHIPAQGELVGEYRRQ